MWTQVLHFTSIHEEFFSPLSALVGGAWFTAFVMLVLSLSVNCFCFLSDLVEGAWFTVCDACVVLIGEIFLLSFRSGWRSMVYCGCDACKVVVSLSVICSVVLKFQIWLEGHGLLCL